jgi:hypothetical protein
MVTLDLLPVNAWLSLRIFAMLFLSTAVFLLLSIGITPWLIHSREALADQD